MILPVRAAAVAFNSILLNAAQKSILWGDDFAFKSEIFNMFPIQH